MHTPSCLLFTMGDPQGIGPEIIVKSFIQKPELFKKIIPVVVGNREILKKYSGNSFPVVSVDSVESAGKYKNSICVINIPKNLSSAELSVEYIDRAVEIIRKNKNRIPLVTAPVSKEKIIKSGINFTGHTEYLAKCTNSKNVAMLMISGKFRVLLTTRHIPLKEVAQKLNLNSLVNQILLTQESLRKHFGIKNILSVICGLNPHCGDGGNIGKEEFKILKPAAEKFKKMGLKVICPVQTSQAFNKYAEKRTLIVCCYHDQGMVPLRLLCGFNIVNFTCGLPFIRTSPGHGPAYDIAGKNVADPSGMVSAIKVAINDY